MTAKTRLLGVDYGAVRVGLAVCDPERIIASPLATYRRWDAEMDAKYFRELVQKGGLFSRLVAEGGFTEPVEPERDEKV